jgi:hypothetical protein
MNWQFEQYVSELSKIQAFSEENIFRIIWRRPEIPRREEFYMNRIEEIE